MGRIGIIGAMDEEVDVLKSEMEVKEVRSIANMNFYIGNLEKKEIVLVRCGIGKVNAAICTQVLISELDANVIINTGVAGAISNDLDVLDIVVSTDVQQHDFDVTGFGHKLGEIPRMEKSIFPADENLINKALIASKEVLKENKTVSGRIVSGDIFVSDSKLKESLLENFGAHCTEMEGAAIGHTCYVNNMPFVIIRAMSDKADGSAHSNFNEFVEQAADHSKDIVKIMLKQM
ncbi:5'-methylthioadenosine/adenosylhomocysteine nucleosidase [Alkaliphilus sp. B6464]|uniref:5'-methylthioadenosine/adenosylhomocysteine nucleosidase n=1 Tax=Alkaliphilus sp. B6464 TaxID=2731219 RepID=UPI001BAC38C4|nr:5'-methylthioadenosine/adenosylhomocysteine nucleosidase [Alkaliphilus sp. B6464]QUH20906.1 5'-methylthioadenosine/adenosylhomocysteine nucleosidase [Alkaliphilus sp. B6464]